jgi:glutamate dehydrogenase (NADP+)
MEAVKSIIETIKQRDPHEKEFIQACEEVLTSLVPAIEKNPKYATILPLLVEPERTIIFRVPWVNDKGEICVNRGIRVQFNSAIGPYKGGCRFRSNVNLSIMKFLAFEQTFKNSLTTLPMGGGKGGSDFDPAGKSEGEVMRFCQSFILELQRHIGQFLDVPAGDIGVGAREIGFMFGQYKRIKNTFEAGVLTGKGIIYGGSLGRTQATGYGLVYFVTEMLKARNDEIKGKRAMVSGSGNVAQYCCEKLLQLGATPVSVSDSKGALLFKDGMTEEHLNAVKHIKAVVRTELSKISELFPDLKGYEYVAGSVWAQSIPCEMALPCATQNEILPEHVDVMVKNGVKLVAEGANMPSTNETIELYMKNNFYYGPGKAANAGGVSVSGLEMTQNSMRLAWTVEEVDEKLKSIMKRIFEAANSAAQEFNVPLFKGANLAGFKKVADAMLAYGCV